jgi:hypothetical protein
MSQKKGDCCPNCASDKFLSEPMASDVGQTHCGPKLTQIPSFCAQHLRIKEQRRGWRLLLRVPGHMVHIGQMIEEPHKVRRAIHNPKKPSNVPNETQNYTDHFGSQRRVATGLHRADSYEVAR